MSSLILWMVFSLLIHVFSHHLNFEAIQQHILETYYNPFRAALDDLEDMTGWGILFPWEWYWVDEGTVLQVGAEAWEGFDEDGEGEEGGGGDLVGDDERDGHGLGGEGGSGGQGQGQGQMEGEGLDDEEFGWSGLLLMKVWGCWILYERRD